MIDFNNLKTICKKNSEILNPLMESVLIPRILHNKKIIDEMARDFSRFLHITRNFPGNLADILAEQYLAHRIFRNNGLALKYAESGIPGNLTGPQRELLEFIASNPWRFRFSMINANPEKDFFDMIDILSEESFLLYSPAVQETLEDRRAILWFNLTGYNGNCWETFGPIGGFQSFSPDDIFFFATELNPRIENEEDLMNNLEKNPVPYMMLVEGAGLPPVFHNDDQLVQNSAVYMLDSIDGEKLKKDFTAEYNRGVNKFSLKNWEDHPHFSAAYHDENKKWLFLSSLTDRGFSSLAGSLRSFYPQISDEPFTRVSVTMIATAEKILKKKIILNEYEKLFYKKPSGEDSRTTGKMNRLLALALPYINSGKEPDIEKLAAESGLDHETVRQIIANVTDKLKDMKNR